MCACFDVSFLLKGKAIFLHVCLTYHWWCPVSQTTGCCTFPILWLLSFQTVFRTLLLTSLSVSFCMMCTPSVSSQVYRHHTMLYIFRDDDVCYGGKHGPACLKAGLQVMSCTSMLRHQSWAQMLSQIWSHALSCCSAHCCMRLKLVIYLEFASQKNSPTVVAASRLPYSLFSLSPAVFYWPCLFEQLFLHFWKETRQ